MPVTAAVAEYVADAAQSLRTAGLRVEVSSGAPAAVGLCMLARCLVVRARSVALGTALNASGCHAGLSVGKAIRAAEKDKVPVMCVVGQREAEMGTVAVRTHSDGDLGSMPVADLVARMAAASAAKRSSI